MKASPSQNGLLKQCFQYAPAFLVGVGVAAFALLPVSEGGHASDFNFSQHLSEQPRGTEAATVTGKAVRKTDTGQDKTESRSVLIPIPGESLKDEFSRMLREFVQAPADERLERLALLLTRLKSKGPAAIPVILEFLRTGKDLPRSALVGSPSFSMNFGNVTSLRA